MLPPIAPARFSLHAGPSWYLLTLQLIRQAQEHVQGFYLFLIVVGTSELGGWIPSKVGLPDNPLVGCVILHNGT